jgi:hypothetical protein
MKDNAILFTTVRILQVHLELDFLIQDLLNDIKITIELSEALQYEKIIYAEYDLDHSICSLIKEKNKRLVILHLGDERANKPIESYKIADSIFRNYYHQDIFENSIWTHKIYWIPNGFRNGLRYSTKQEQLRADQRKNLAVFIGWLDNENSLGDERKLFAHETEHVKDLMQCISTSGFAQGFSPILYQHFMKNSVYAPCPAGNAAETIRLFDALECGSIPIILKHEFLRIQKAMPLAPFIFLNNWSELRIVLLELSRRRMEQPESAISQQLASIKYWRRLKERSTTEMHLTLA